jgi:hypothetical protein
MDSLDQSGAGTEYIVEASPSDGEPFEVSDTAALLR